MLKRFFKGNISAGIIVGLLLLMLGTMIVFAVRFYTNTDPYTKQYMFMNGRYRVDGGEWKTIDPNQPLTDRFHRIEFRGTITGEAAAYTMINISSKDVWFTLEKADGTRVLEHVPKTLDERVREQLSGYYEELPEGVTAEVRRNIERTFPMELRHPESPGYCRTGFIPYHWALQESGRFIDITTELVFTVWTRDDSSNVSLSDSFLFYYGTEGGQYLVFFEEVLPALLLFAAVLLFGLVFFPMAGFIQGKIDYKYITFGALCFFWSLYMILDKAGFFLNLWIRDSVTCEMLVRMMGTLFITALLLYLRSNMKSDRNRMISGIIVLLFTVVIFVFGILMITGTMDIMLEEILVNYLIAFSILVLILLLLTEVKVGQNALLFLISWGPLALSILLQIVLRFMGIGMPSLFMVGIAFTMIYQIIRLIIDLRRQYLEAIRYQKMQKELYEAKVAVMVSQVQPHFMYNALSSIAMLCKVNPDTAYEATIAFTEYLRGNMDSLKQKTPVPFEKELEHLKKYLFIEQLRFGKKLKIEYDIQTMDFEVPQLSVQPLVENAVKHGVGMKKKGGTVKISTLETEEGFEIVITDDGVGFDPNAPKKEDGRSHVGMENTRRRLLEMIGAEVVITSVVGEGTTARVVIPREKPKTVPD